MPDIGHHYRDALDFLRRAGQEVRREHLDGVVRQALGHLWHPPGRQGDREVGSAFESLQCAQPVESHEGGQSIRVARLCGQHLNRGGVFES